MSQPKAKIKLLLSCILVSLLVTLTYYLFEYAIHHSITYIWNTVFDTQNKRVLVIPLAIVGALLFYGLQHYLDPKSEKQESHGIGGDPIKPTLNKLILVLLIGFFSLVGGASLGPEAILVPACMIIGGYVGLKLFKHDANLAKALPAAAVMALMTAFFHSYIIGILSVLLVAKIAKTKVNIQLIIIAVLSSVTAYLFLNFIDPKNSYFNFPHFTWKIALIDITMGVALIVAGYISTFILKFIHTVVVSLKNRVNLSNWWLLAMVAGIGLSLIYIIGGPLVEFTGNESIAPLIKQASSLGLWGVFWIFIIKLLAIGWSKSLGYRGGLIFPMIFVASSLVAMSQLLASDVNFGIGIIAAVAGMLIAEKKAHILL